jgi:hypothetical protein
MQRNSGSALAWQHYGEQAWCEIVRPLAGVAAAAETAALLGGAVSLTGHGSRRRLSN